MSRNLRFRNLKSEQTRAGLTNKQVAEYLGISVNAYMFKNRTGKFLLEEIRGLMDLFGCTFDYLFKEDKLHERR